MADIFDYVDCEGCRYYKKGYFGGDVCTNGDFGADYPCKEMLSCIADGCEDGDFELGLSYLVNTNILISPETRGDYAETLAAWPFVKWDKHRYWQIFYYDDIPPEGYDSLEEVYERVFQD